MDLSHGQVIEGGSTITQQLVKNLYTGDAQSLRRKIEEAALAMQMEQRYTKDEILTMYLNTVYFGEGAYGIEAAAETYFGLHASDLTLSQSAMLAGLVTSPNHFDPFVRPDSARGRRDVVLRIMRQMGTITTHERRRARLQPIRVRHDGAETDIPLSLLHRLLQALVPVQPRVRRDLRRPVQAVVHRGPSDHDNP